jgi:hypothetical protein
MHKGWSIRVRKSIFLIICKSTETEFFFNLLDTNKWSQKLHKLHIPVLPLGFVTLYVAKRIVFVFDSDTNRIFVVVLNSVRLLSAKGWQHRKGKNRRKKEQH